MRPGPILLAVLVATACGGEDKQPEAPPAEPRPALPTLELPPVGVAAAKDLNYPYLDGAKAYAKAAEAAKKQDWAAVKAAAEEALARDAGHLDAHRALGSALARLGDAEGATRHLLVALAGDFLRWGPKLPEDPDLADTFATPHGKALLAAHLELKAAVEKATAGGVWLLARRSTFKWPAKSGYASTRGELYAWDEPGRRLIRLTHTDHTLAAWMWSPSGDELVLVGFDQAQLPAAKGKAKEPAPPTIRAWVEAVDPRTWEPRSKRAVFTKTRAVAVTYGPGGQLLVETMKAQGRWGLAPEATWSIDRTTGKAVKTKGAPDPSSGRIVVSLDEAIVTTPPRGLELTPSPQDPALISELRVASTGRTIGLPLTGLGDASVPRLNPSGSRVAFATWADPCARDGAKPTLFVADARTGALEHLLTADARFALRWLDDDRLVYEDGTGSLRIWDAATRRETGKVGERAGYALHGLSASPAPVCRKQAIEVEPDDGSDTPAEEPGPATTPT